MLFKLSNAVLISLISVKGRARSEIEKRLLVAVHNCIPNLTCMHLPDGSNCFKLGMLLADIKVEYFSTSTNGPFLNVQL